VFDIVIPTYNRYAQLPEFFSKNALLEHAPAILWVIDDHSPHFMQAVIPSWINIRFIRLERNNGQAYARNLAIAKGYNQYVISLDDDAWFEDAEMSLNELASLFNTYPGAGCVMFNIATPDSPNATLQTGTILPLHVTCGCAYRREVLEQIKGFSDFLHSQAEETDISLRIYQAGWNIIFSNKIRVFHNFSPGKRTLQWYYDARHNTTRNDLLVVVMYFPALLAVPLLIGKYLSHLKFAVTNRVSIFKTLVYTLKALFSFLKLLPKAIMNRRPLSRTQFRYWRLLSKSSTVKEENVYKF